MDTQLTLTHNGAKLILCPETKVIKLSSHIEDPQKIVKFMRKIQRVAEKRHEGNRTRRNF
jgi:hypothetical protein